MKGSGEAQNVTLNLPFVTVRVPLGPVATNENVPDTAVAVSADMVIVPVVPSHSWIPPDVLLSEMPPVPDPSISF